MDAPGNAKAGVEGANRMFATGTPNPPCSETVFNTEKIPFTGAVRERPNRAPC